MAASRTRIPKRTQEELMKEFRHRCAVCGGDRPQLHHIDGDPGNNELLNLIPLCPNCHLLDQHDPTATTDPAKLRLFRRFRDPAILKAQFHPLFVRLRFLDEIKEDSDAAELASCAAELLDFIGSLSMGSFYAKRIRGLIQRPNYASIVVVGDRASEARARESEFRADRDYRELLKSNRDAAIALVVESLRFQQW